MSKTNKKTKKSIRRRIFVDLSNTKAIEDSKQCEIVPGSIFESKTERLTPKLTPKKIYSERESSPRKKLLEDISRYEMYLQSTLKDLKKCVSLPLISMLDIVKRQVTLSYSHLKNTVIFDLDDTLIHSTQDSTNPDTVLSINDSTDIGLKVRPFALQCLNAISSKYEVVVFTASKKEYADAILNYLDPLNQLISYRLYREHCVPVSNVLVKDLRVLLNRNIKNMLLVDNSCLSFANQLDNGVPIRSWTGETNDRELMYLTNYLLPISHLDDLREINRRKFRLSGNGPVNLRLS